MKKLLISFLVFVAIAGFGGNIVSAHAETLTPDQAAALQATVNSLKAKLVELQAEAAAQSHMSTPAPVVAPAPTEALTAQDVTSLKNALGALAATLTNLGNQFATSPQIFDGHEQAVLAALEGMGATLTSIGTEVRSMSIASAAPAAPAHSNPVAMATPSSPSPASLQPTQSAIPAAGSGNGAENGSENANVVTNAAPVTETAQISGTFSWKSLNWPLVAVVILILIAIALWLFWPGVDEEDSRNTDARATSPAIKPAPTSQASMLASAKSSATPPPSSPGMAAKVMTPQQPQQQRKPA